jgi:hypothetical protein
MRGEFWAAEKWSVISDQWSVINKWATGVIFVSELDLCDQSVEVRPNSHQVSDSRNDGIALNWNAPRIIIDFWVIRLTSGFWFFSMSLDFWFWRLNIWTFSAYLKHSTEPRFDILRFHELQRALHSPRKNSSHIVQFFLQNCLPTRLPVVLTSMLRWRIGGEKILHSHARYLDLLQCIASSASSECFSKLPCQLAADEELSLQYHDRLTRFKRSVPSHIHVAIDQTAGLPSFEI